MADRILEHINREAREDARGMIARADAAYRTFLDDLCARIVTGGHIRLVLLAGPSGSGKTTTANLLADAIRRAGHESHVISLDNFYREGRDPLYPRMKDGSRDLESYKALNLPLVRETLGRAARGESFAVPHYDFKMASYLPDSYAYHATEDGVIIVEGLHALNPAVTQGLSKDSALKIFISVSTNLTYGGERVLSGRKLRFVRRLVRDHLYRGSSAERTLALWRGVLRGEDAYLYPYRGEADVSMDTFHDYEIGLLCQQAHRVLTEQPLSDPFAEVVLHAISLAHPIDDKLVPNDSLMREFIRGGMYEHLY